LYFIENNLNIKSKISLFLNFVIILFLFLNGCGNTFDSNDYEPLQNYTGSSSENESVDSEAFSIILLPDTQYYSLDYPNLFTGQTSWAVDNKEELNIEMVLHEGDLTHKNTDEEWENAVNSMSVLDGIIPYVICIGNHDDDTNRDTIRFNIHFLATGYKDQVTMAGIFEANKLDNSYHFIEAGGIDWMIISLEYDPRSEVLEWANRMVSTYKKRKVILLTHAYLMPGNKRGSIGNNIWDNFVRYHENIVMTFNGHYTDDVGSRLVSTGDNGNKVYQIFANYQNELCGGQGLLRIVQIDPVNKTLSVRTYSTWMNNYLEDDTNQFEYLDVDFLNID